MKGGELEAEVRLFNAIVIISCDPASTFLEQGKKWGRIAWKYTSEHSSISNASYFCRLFSSVCRAGAAFFGPEPKVLGRSRRFWDGAAPSVVRSTFFK